jgi:hypothetical protein
MPQILVCNGLAWHFNDQTEDELAKRWAQPAYLGFLPGFLHANNPAPAVEQLDTGYGYPGNWHSEPNGLLPDDSMTYPGDPPLIWAAQTQLRDERILFYPYAIVAVVQPDRSFVTQRID